MQLLPISYHSLILSSASFPRWLDAAPRPHRTLFTLYSPMGKSVLLLPRMLFSGLTISVQCSPPDVCGFCHPKSPPDMDGAAPQMYFPLYWRMAHRAFFGTHLDNTGEIEIAFPLLRFTTLMYISNRPKIFRIA